MAKKKSIVTEYDPKEHSETWENIKTEATQLKSEYEERDNILDQLAQFWDLDPMDLPGSQAPTAAAGMKVARGDTDDFKVTIAPDGANRMVGAWRLLSATEPEFELAADENTRKTMANASKLELAANRIWRASGKIRGQPLEKDAVLSAIWAAEVHIEIDNHLLLELDDDTPLRIREAVERVPGGFRILSPRTGYALWDRWGLNSYLQVYDTTVKELKAEWPGVEIDYVSKKKGTDEITVNHWRDDDWRAVWIEGDTAPFYWYENDLGFINVWVQIVEGTQLFVEPHRRARPYMYTHWKSGMSNRQNLAYTALFNNIEALALSGVFKHQLPPQVDDREIQVKQKGPYRYIDMMQGEDLVPMIQKGAIDPALLTAIELAERKAGESTIYSQALGEPLGANAPFSMVALLHQAGRLPLVNPKVLTGWAIGGATDLLFKWLKKTGKTMRISEDMSDVLELEPDMIPENIQYKATLEIDLPQDQDTNTRVAQGGVKSGLWSKAWARQNLVKGIGQPELMQEEIWSEQFGDFFANLTLQGFMRALQQGQAGDQGQGETDEQAPAERRAPTPEGVDEAPLQEEPLT